MTSNRMRRLMRRAQGVSRPLRLALGVALVVGGVLGFLPIVGFWMLPLGLLVLSLDLPFIRRLHSRLRRNLRAWWRRRGKSATFRVEPMCKFYEVSV